MNGDAKIQWLNSFEREGMLDRKWLKQFKDI